MRLINTKTLRFEEVADSELDAPENKYAILSHRWGAKEDEVLFSDINGSLDISNKKGFAKLQGFCNMAVKLGCDYGWIDTCCINKGDSSETTEAINSMYRWYGGSHICIVHLEDVPEKPMIDSSWFDRGWTLQELIAPKAALFLMTRIPEGVLSHTRTPASCSVAQRFSWAADRKTTRVEDRAYSLLGIFGVSIPSIYGEREQAFIRLQRAVIQQTKDESIFAWSMGIGEDKKGFNGLLAPSPSSFVDCRDIISIRGSTGFSEANGELSIKSKSFPHSMESYYITLNCIKESAPDFRIGIVMTRAGSEDDYVRVKKAADGGRVMIKSSNLVFFKERRICVPLHPTEPPLNRAHGFWLRTIQPPGYATCDIKILSANTQLNADRVYLAERGTGTAGVVSLEPKAKPDSKHTYNIPYQSGWSRIRWIMLAFDEEFNPYLYLANAKGLYSLITQSKFEQAIKSEDGSQARNKILGSIWPHSQATVPSRSYGWPTGISILKVDRTTGLQGCLEALSLDISISLVPEISPNSMPNRSTDEREKQIWAVDIRTAAGKDPETQVAEAQRMLEKEEFSNSCLQFCFNDCWGGPSASLVSQRENAHGQSKVLGASDLIQIKSGKHSPY